MYRLGTSVGIAPIAAPGQALGKPGAFRCRFHSTMSKKFLPILLIPLATALGPYGLYNASQWWSQAKDAFYPTASVPGPATIGGAGTPSATGPAAASASGRATGAKAGGEISPLASTGQGPVVADLAEVLRFDVTPDWIIQRWPLVSAGLSSLTLQGYRVPLVTGTQPDDLTGALTYYFDARQQVRRITLQGTTGDGRRLIQLLVGRFHFGRRLTNDPGIVRYEVPESRGPARSFLELRMAKPTDAHHRFDVSLVMERPEKG